MTQFGLFLLQVVLISLSGVLSPGPITAATISHGSKNKFAGLPIALGHGIVELPLVILIMFGLGTVLAYNSVQLGIGFIGGMFLLSMAWGMFKQARTHYDQPQTSFLDSSPLVTGMILSATNPYFLLWWATIGITLATTASGYGVLGFAVFAAVHWICDLIWLMFLSYASKKGTDVFGSKLQKTVLAFCALIMFFFGLMFIFNAARKLLQT